MPWMHSAHYYPWIAVVDVLPQFWIWCEAVVPWAGILPSRRYKYFFQPPGGGPQLFHVPQMYWVMDLFLTSPEVQAYGNWRMYVLKPAGMLRNSGVFLSRGLSHQVRQFVHGGGRFAIHTNSRVVAYISECIPFPYSDEDWQTFCV